MYVAEQLIRVLSDLRSSDREIQMQLRAPRRELTRHTRDRAPRRAQDALDVIVMLDAPSWAALVASLGECPVLHAAVRASQQGCRTIEAGNFEFISHESQIKAIRRFMASLPSRLIEM